MKKVICVLCMLMLCFSGYAKKSSKKTNKEPNPYENYSIEEMDSVLAQLKLEKEQRLAELERVLDSINHAEPVSEREMLLQAQKNGEINLPCFKDAVDTEDEYREFGMSDWDVSYQYASVQAVRNAQEMLLNRLEDGEYSFDDMFIICRQMGRDSMGNYISYVVISIRKDQIKKQSEIVE